MKSKLCISDIEARMKYMPKSQNTDTYVSRRTIENNYQMCNSI